MYRLAIAQVMANAVQAVDLMYALGGATAADTYELAGRLLLGLDPSSPNI